MVHRFRVHRSGLHFKNLIIKDLTPHIKDLTPHIRPKRGGFWGYFDNKNNQIPWSDPISAHFRSISAFHLFLG